jgi:predicted NBD/HSP70 family sugar kinase
MAVEGAALEPPTRILAIDVGGTNMKVLATGSNDVRKAPSGPSLTPAQMVEQVRRLASEWLYEAVSIGYPGLVGSFGPVCEPGNLGPGWVGFDFAAAFERPVKVLNDAAMQALGSYEGGRMLFLGLGTGLGSALIVDRAIVPLELGHLPSGAPGVSLCDVLCRRGLARLGRRKWRRRVREAACDLMKAMLVDYVVLGGGIAKEVGAKLPHGVRLGHNLTAFRGGFRLWGLESPPVFSHGSRGSSRGANGAAHATHWRLL